MHQTNLDMQTTLPTSSHSSHLSAEAAIGIANLIVMVLIPIMGYMLGQWLRRRRQGKNYCFAVDGETDMVSSPDGTVRTRSLNIRIRETLIR